MQQRWKHNKALALLIATAFCLWILKSPYYYKDLNRILALDFAASLRSLRGSIGNKKSNGITTFKDVRSLNSYLVVV
jgi:hypothetical protein